MNIFSIVTKQPATSSRRVVARCALAAIAGGLFSLCGANRASADAIPYPNTGTYNPVSYSFTATTTGDVVGYFVGTDAYYDSKIGLLDNGVLTSAGYGLDNHSSAIGDSFDFGKANAGDVLTFVLDNTSLSQNLYSNPSLNTAYDTPGETIGHDHIYSTAYTATSPIYAGVPAGTYLAFEDEVIPGANFNYADENFVLTNVSSTSSVPEPASLAMIGIGTLTLIARRKRA